MIDLYLRQGSTIYQKILVANAYLLSISGRILYPYLILNESADKGAVLQLGRCR